MLSDSLFVTDHLHERAVELADGSKHVLHFREVSSAVMRRYQMAENSANEDVRVSSMAVLIASSVVNPDGTPAMDVERAQKLKPQVTNALMREILDLNSIGAAEKKASPPATSDGSGTSSPSPSAANP
jgi:hypothetical protein